MINVSLNIFKASRRLGNAKNKHILIIHFNIKKSGNSQKQFPDLTFIQISIISKSSIMSPNLACVMSMPKYFPKC